MTKRHAFVGSCLSLIPGSAGLSPSINAIRTDPSNGAPNETFIDRCGLFASDARDCPARERRCRDFVELLRAFGDSHQQHAAGGIACAGDSARVDLRRRQRHFADVTNHYIVESPVQASASEVAATPAPTALRSADDAISGADGHNSTALQSDESSRQSKTVRRGSHGPHLGRTGRLNRDPGVAQRMMDPSTVVPASSRYGSRESGSRRRPPLRRICCRSGDLSTPFAMRGARRCGRRTAARSTARVGRDYNEVKALGAAVGSTRTADQSRIALFWADGAGTETPPGHWNHIAQDVAAAQGNTLVENARLFALLNSPWPMPRSAPGMPSSRSTSGGR